MEASMESSDGVDGGTMGKIDLWHGDPSVVDLTNRVHLLPCVVKHDGPCPISHYFKPRKSDLVCDGLAVEEAFFRGRKLQGVTVSIPEGYRGYVLAKKKLTGGSDMEANSWVSNAEFQNITYWNHDGLPSKQDPLTRCFQWFAVADALHEPITKEELAFASAAQDN
ncbi:hypothetical protein HPP92_003756 [Vanilla planifolia]|uniref:Uncharacterized protein n=1 Tax=Vanilla planifolia TaxID=51239 RepID=A0A835VJN5_VANPL|nr:hypothetical protein HPP92_004186 [Vanilla planifolia]KAG0503684.1 hypothetical protein HPP92_003756 [Vanilla planifolia]